MAGHSSFNWGILLSVLISAGLVGGAYALSTHSITPKIAEASTETALLQTIASRDADRDGLPDWEEALYGTDPKKSDTKGLGMNDGEAVAKGLIVPKAIADIPLPAATTNGSVSTDISNAAPVGTLTDLFARNFFTLYLSKKNDSGGAALTQQETTEIAKKALSQLSSAVAPAPDFKNTRDVAINGSGADAFRTYAASVEKVYVTHTVNSLPKGELEYLQDTLDGDSSALVNIRAISKAYTDTATGLAALSVPKELASIDLSLINAMARMGSITADFARVDTDPIATMLALQQYTQAARNLNDALVAIAKAYAEANVSISNTEPGGVFLFFVDTVRNPPPPSKP